MQELNHATESMVSHMNTVNPTPVPDALSITGIIKRSGKIAGYQLSNGEQITKDEGVAMAKQNRIRGVGIAKNQGTEYLRALPDGNERNNLSNLPTIVR